jgi:hypothetical protein
MVSRRFGKLWGSMMHGTAGQLVEVTSSSASVMADRGWGGRREVGASRGGVGGEKR